MLKKTIRRLGALAMVLAMAVSVFAVNASAADTGEETPAVTHATVSFNKVIDMTNATGANVPAGKYSFTVESGTAVPATADSPEIKAGVGKPIITDVEYGYGNYGTNDETKTATVDFTGITFPTAGIYRYKITETASTNTDVAIDAAPVRYLDVYVVNTANGTKIEWYVLLKTAVTPTKNTNGQWDYGTANKSEGFTNTYTTYTLNLQKIIAGNMANMTEKFEFTINFEGPAGAKFKYGNETITLGTDGKASLTIPELGHKATALIQGIPSTVSYTIAETVKTNAGYETAYTQTGVEGSTNGVTTTKKVMGKQNNEVVFTNTKINVSPTGVIMTIAPYALMVVLAGAFAVVFLTRRNRAE